MITQSKNSLAKELLNLREEAYSSPIDEYADLLYEASDKISEAIVKGESLGQNIEPLKSISSKLLDLADSVATY